MNRTTSRVYSPAVTGLTNSYYLYDQQSRITCETTTSVTTCPTTGSGIKNNHSLSPPFMSAGDWKQVLRPVPGSTGGLTNNFNTSGTTYGSSHQVTDVNQSDGTPTLGHTAMAYDVFGNRSYDDNTTTLTNDCRDYTYDGRHNLVNVRGQYYTGSAWHYYDVASAFDAKDRRVFKSFYDESTTKTAEWFFYYDAVDRLTEVRYTPDISSSGTYSVFQLFWLGNTIVAYWQTDAPSSTVSKRYVVSDELGRPLQLWNWPSSGDSTRVWAINPNAWGQDTNIVGPSVYQPILFSGQYQDVETAAYENDGATVHRPPLALNRFRTYDPLLGAYIQFDPRTPKTWSSYLYVSGNPIGRKDPKGLMMKHDSVACDGDGGAGGHSSGGLGECGGGGDGGDGGDGGGDGGVGGDGGDGGGDSGYDGDGGSGTGAGSGSGPGSGSGSEYDICVDNPDDAVCAAATECGSVETVGGFGFNEYVDSHCGAGTCSGGLLSDGSCNNYCAPTLQGPYSSDGFNNQCGTTPTNFRQPGGLVASALIPAESLICLGAI